MKQILGENKGCNQPGYMHTSDDVTPRENKGTEREAPGPGLGKCQFH